MSDSSDSSDSSDPSSSSYSSESDYSDYSRSPRNRKRLKSSISNEPDRISTLPDTILHQILSFIDTKQVVRSCIISKRWKSLWKAVPSLNFFYLFLNNQIEDTSSNEKKKWGIVRFVDRVLLLRDEDVNIEKFSLMVSTSESLSVLQDFKDWIVIAKRKHVQEFSLEVQTREWMSLPKLLFSLDIQVLKIISLDRKAKIHERMRVAPHLRSMDLYGSKLRSGKRRRWELNIKCPLLENLIISNCDHRSIRVLEISAPRLKTLVLENKTSDNTRTCKLRISTSSLQSIVLKGATYREYSFTNLKSLVNAKFDLEEHSVEAQILYQFLDGVSNARNLQLSGLTMKPSEEALATDMLENFVKPFLRLHCLRIVGFGDGSFLGPICDLLENSHRVENLVLGINQLSTYKDWEGLHQCFSRLKSIEIQGITGKAEELEVIKFISNTAVRLEAFTVTADAKFSLKTKREQASFSFMMHSLRKSTLPAGILFKLIC